MIKRRSRTGSDQTTGLTTFDFKTYDHVRPLAAHMGNNESMEWFGLVVNEMIEAMKNYKNSHSIYNLYELRRGIAQLEAIIEEQIDRAETKTV